MLYFLSYAAWPCSSLHKKYTQFFFHEMRYQRRRRCHISVWMRMWLEESKFGIERWKKTQRTKPKFQFKAHLSLSLLTFFAIFKFNRFTWNKTEQLNDSCCVMQGFKPRYADYCKMNNQPASTNLKKLIVRVLDRQGLAGTSCQRVLSPLEDSGNKFRPHHSIREPMQRHLKAGFARRKAKFRIRFR